MSIKDVMRQTRIDTLKKLCLPIRKTKDFIVKPNYKTGQLEVIKNKTKYEMMEK